MSTQNLYCVNTNAQSNGDYEVHNLATCGHLPDVKNQKRLGSHSNCQSAVKEAKKTYATADGCAYCCPDCHTS